MGADYSAVAGFGVCFDQEELFREHSITVSQPCQHVNPTAMLQLKFCPECGKPLHLTRVKKEPFLKGFSVDQELWRGPVSNTEWDVIRLNITKEVFIGHGIRTGSTSMEPLCLDLDLIRLESELKADLGGLWDEDRFDFWAGLDVSI